ncbi:MAG: hypothetical protein JST75_09390 [Bacteroidetes bacterium]|nr:hypothetical protein [Bacteroidota bacterium]
MGIEKHFLRGIVERYMIGLMNEKDTRDFEELVKKSPALQEELRLFEIEMNAALQTNTEYPIDEKIWSEVREKIKTAVQDASMSSDAIRLAKDDELILSRYWKTVFFIVLVLSKIFLFFSIFYFLKFRSIKNDYDVLIERQNIRKESK